MSLSRKRLVTSLGVPQQLLAVEGVDSWGLIFIVFEGVTQLYGLNLEDGQMRPIALQGSRTSTFGLEVLHRITADIETRHIDSLIRKERFLRIRNHQAVAMCEFLQEVLCYLQ